MRPAFHTTVRHRSAVTGRPFILKPSIFYRFESRLRELLAETEGSSS